MPRETKAELEARITDQSSIIDRYARMIESLEHERDSLKDTIREQTLNHCDAKQQVISLSKECDLVGGALELEIGERKNLLERIESQSNRIDNLKEEIAEHEKSDVHNWDTIKGYRYAVRILGDAELMKEHEESKGGFGEDRALTALIALSQEV